MRAILGVIENASLAGDGISPAALKMRVASMMAMEAVSTRKALEAEINEVDPKKKPESKAKKFGKFVGRAAIGLLLRRFK